MKKLVSALLALAAFITFALPAGAAKPVTVWEDPAGDADVGQGLGQSLPGGWDLASATILKKGANLEFTVTHHDMPPAGTAPEATRFLWNFSVNGKDTYRLTVKSVDIGKPDALAQSGTERVGQVDVDGHFRLEGECATDSTLPVGMVNCPVVGYLEGAWDPASMSFTVTVPLKTIKAKPGSTILQGPDNICTVCWVTHYAERSLNSTIIDAAVQTIAYKIPKK
jgi:hypothetical protein